MALDNVLKIYDEQGNPVDYDILASDVKFQDGKDLPTKMGELEEEIGEGGYTPPQGGIPKTDLAPAVQTSLDKADTAYQKPASGIPATDIADGVIPDTSNLATKTDLAGKVDKTDYTDSDKNKLRSLPADPVQSISVNGTPQQMGQNGNVNIQVSGGGSVDSVTINGTKHTPDANGDVDLGTIVGQKGDKGDTGNVEFEDLEDLVALLVNDLTTGGAGNFLSAEMGKRLKDKIEEVQANILRLYNNLGNIAFWDATAKTNAAPTTLDWSGPKHIVTLSLSLFNATVTHNGVAKSSGDTIQVEEGSKLTLIVAASGSGYAFNKAPTASAGGSSITPTLNQDGTYTIELTMGQSDVALTISASASIGTLFLRGYVIGTDNRQITDSALTVGGNNLTPKMCLSDYILMPTGNEMKELTISYGIARASQNLANGQAPSSFSFFKKENGGYVIMNSFAMDGGSKVRTCNATYWNNFDAAKKTAILAAMSAGNLYIRIEQALTTAGGDTIDTSCYLKWGDDYLFNASNDDYTVTADTTAFEPYTIPS